ncbi:MAG: acyl-CoA carboxylase subunit beta [Alphaproteobacteria bacterium]|jgi:acetyl-CoA carboxylase carboxyltransferase component
MSHAEKLAELARRRAENLAMGGARKLEARSNSGILNARERLDYLLDDDSFLEAGLHAFSIRPETREKSPADGKIAGYGKVDGRPVALVANDFTVLGASSSQVNMKKMGHMKKTARERGMPLVLLGESSGGRMPDRMGASGRATIGQDREEYRRTRETPWVSTLMGQSYGSSTWYSVISDVVFARKGAVMAVTSPRVTSLAIGQEITPEELGGWKLHTEVTGLVDQAFDTDEEVLDAVKKFLSYLPSNAGEAPPVADVPEGSDEEQDKILDIVPAERQRVYDVRRVLRVIADNDTLFELKSRFGRAVVTALARVGGRTVGFLANNPLVKGGAIDPDACDKAVSFMVLCDSFNIPLISMVDQPGFFIGLEGERKRAPGKIMNWMNAHAQMTVPRFSVIMRKSFGQAYLNMGGGRNADEVLAWPTADLGFMEPRLAVNVLHGVRVEDEPERFAELAAELDRDTEAWDLAGLYEAQYVIDPKDTREHLIRLLEVYQGKQVGQHLLSNWPTTF